jgi:hypothetical protein
MAVMVLDVPIPAWNETVLQCVMYGLDICPDDHREGNTVVEITGTMEKLQQVFDKISSRAPDLPVLLAVMESKPIDRCG